jgi:hypothetical protein
LLLSVLSPLRSTDSKEAGSTPGPPPVRNQPQYSSLAVLSRDDSVSYKVEGSGSGSGSSVRGAALMGEEDEIAVSDLEDREAAEIALALAQIERLESGIPMEAENDVKVAEIAKKKEKKKVLKKSAAAVPGPVDGWGSAFKAVGIGAPSKKLGKGLSLAKPFKKVPSSTSADSIMGLGLDVKEAAVAPSRSFDDLKQMGRLHRDYGDQLQYSEKTNDSTDYTRKEREIQKALCAEDFPALNMIPPVLGPASAIGLSYHRKNDNSSSSTADSSYAGNAPPPPPGLSVEQRNENIRAFVAESKLRQAASSSSLSSLDPLGGNGEGARADPSKSSSQGCGNWTKMGGVTVLHSASASNDYLALGAEYQNYTSATPFSISDSDYPSLGPGPGSSISGANKKDSKGRTNYSAAAALSGNGSALVPTKSSEDFLAAKKEKVAKKLSAQIQELSLK